MNYMNKYVQILLGTWLTIKIAKYLFGFLLLVGFVLLAPLMINNYVKEQEKITNSGMTITASDFKGGDRLPLAYTCEGEGVMPDLTVSSIPPEAKYISLDLVESAPGKSAVIWHWTAWNIPVKDGRVSTAELPSSYVTGLNDFNEARYTAPCRKDPRAQPSKYLFRVSAQSGTINLTPEESKRTYEYGRLIVGRTEIVAEY